jgi:hypothetical protein
MATRAMSALYLGKIFSFSNPISNIRCLTALSACSSPAASFAAPFSNRILGIKRMTVFAMRFAGEEVGSQTSMNLPGNDPEVGWIHAGSCFADMVKFQSSWNWTVKELVDESMSPKGFVMACQQAISELMSASSPDPTAGCRIWSNFPLNASRQFLERV